jgi:hypothetical protein
MASRRGAVRTGTARRLTAAHSVVDVQLRIELEHITPLIWRRVRVAEAVTLATLHHIVKAAMGWSDSHLHEFEIARRRYGVPDDDEWPESEPLIDERRARLQSFVEARVRRFRYTYDFGDNWQHLMKIEDIVPRGTNQPLAVCIAGENRCPPEDVGGASGYAEFLGIVKNAQHPEHADMLQWAGGPFDPTEFDMRIANRRLAYIKR